MTQWCDFPLFFIVLKGDRMHSYTKEEARTIIMQCAKSYDKRLAGKQFLFIYRDRIDNFVKCFEVYFGKENYQHLTGLDLVDEKGVVREHVAELFYDKCLNNRLGKDEIQFKKDGTTNLKLVALPALMKIQEITKIAGGYNGIRPYLIADKVIGNVNFCLGIIRDSKNNYYVPASSLLEDIKKLTNNPSQVLAIFSKTTSDNVYKKVCYVAKGINLHKLTIPHEILKVVSLEDYIFKG